jgi:hypothetical protein
MIGIKRQNILESVVRSMGAGMGDCSVLLMSVSIDYAILAA